MKRNTALLFIMLILTPASLHAQEKMDLKACMRYAIENSLKIKAQETETDDARLARRNAILNAFTPEISAGTYVYSNFGRSVDPETNTYVSTTSFNNGYSVSGNIILFNGFSAVNNIKIRNTAMKMGKDKEEMLRNDICLATMEAYYNVVYYQKLVQLLEMQVKTASEALTLSERQEELGQKGYADVIEMRAEVADREYQMTAARNMYSDALLTLKDLMFWPLDQEMKIDVSITEGQEYSEFISLYERNAVKANALATLPEISIAESTLRNAMTEYKGAKWRFTPTLSLNAGWSTNYYTYPGQQGYVPTPYPTQFKNNGGEYIQLSLSIPVFSGLSNYTNLKMKKNACKRASIDYEQTLRSVEAEVERALQDYEGSVAALIQADRRNEVQEESYRLNVSRLNQGLISPLEFRQASDSWIEANTTKLEAILKCCLKRSIVNYYDGIDYLDQ